MEIALTNDGFVRCWNEILTPKWIRFRHLLSGNGAEHSDGAFDRGIFRVDDGERVLDVGCGFGESCLQLGRAVGPSGEIIREAGDEGRARLSEIRRDLEEIFGANLRDGGVFMPSSSWAIAATRTRD